MLRMQRSLHRRDVRGDGRTGHGQINRDFGCSIEVFATRFPNVIDAYRAFDVHEPGWMKVKPTP